MHQNVVQRGYWESGATSPPMPQKRKKQKKEKKNKKGISAPAYVRYVDRMEMPGLLQYQSKFPVEHIATMALGELQASPTDTFHKMKKLLHIKPSVTKDVLLCITGSNLTVKDGMTKEPLLTIPLDRIVEHQYIQDSESQSSILMIKVQDEMCSSGHNTHFFQCSKSPAEVICKEIDHAKLVCGAGSMKTLEQSQRIDVNRNNWFLQAPPNHPPSPSIQSPKPSQSPQPAESALLRFRGSQEIISDPTNLLQYSRSTHLESVASGSGRTPSKSSSTSDIRKIITSRSLNEGGERSEVRRRMKASRIQRDVDILNHVMEDLDNFISLLKSKTTAWNELEKKRKKSKRKKHDAALEELRKKAEPPSEVEFSDVYRKCKFALNLIAKLGHHLSAPSASKLQSGIFSRYIAHFVSINKGPSLASAVVSPLLTQSAIDMLKKKLPPSETELWKQLGANWFLTLETWPESAPSPPNYEISFKDGCVPPNLHNASDCPSNFPTLDTIPREQRANDTEYSEAYDTANQPETESFLMINPAVKAAVESQFTGKNTVPDFVLKLGETKVTSHGNGSNSARALFLYNATTEKELSVNKGDSVEVLDQSRQWWKVKNQHGQIGFVPGNLMEAVPLKRQETKPGTASPSIPPEMPRRPSMSPAYVGNKPPQQIPLSPIQEETAEYLSFSTHPPLPPPPSFSPTLPHQSTAAPAPPPPLPPTTSKGGPPLPPPPPPIVAPKAQMTLSEMIAQHKQKSKLKGKVSIVQTKGNDDNQFDITEALKSAKPLRKTTRANLTGDVIPGDHSTDSGPILPGIKQPLQTQIEPGVDYCVLPWRLDQAGIKLWLTQQGYQTCSAKLPATVKEGSQLYAMDREDLREMFGPSEGVRLYSQLQKDKSKSESGAGIVRETEFQKVMRIRKKTLDHGQATSIMTLKEKETLISDDVEYARGAKYPSKNIQNGSKYKKNDEVKRSYRKPRSQYQSGSYSDGESPVQRKRNSRSKRKSKYSDSKSESSSYKTRMRRKERATNIDDFDWSDSGSDSESRSYSESSSEEQYPLRSSASVFDMANTTWALEGTASQEFVIDDARIKAQQNEIKLLLGNLKELQKKCNLKTLPAEKQSLLQRDLKILAQLEVKRKHMPGNISFATQLMGQQMLLTDHLKETIEFLNKEHSKRYQEALSQLQTTVIPQPLLGHHHPLAHQLIFDAEQQLHQQQLLFAEQQRQLQLAQFASQQPRLLGVHSPTFGVYNTPYAGLTYF